MLHSLLRPKTAAAAVTLVFVLLLAALAIGVIAISKSDDNMPILLSAFASLPFYLWAIWTARRAILLIGSGQALQSVLSSMLRRIGLALLAGGLADVFGRALGIRLAMGFGSYARFDPAAITIGVIGVTLMIVARLVRDAEELRAELDAFV